MLCYIWAEFYSQIISSYVNTLGSHLYISDKKICSPVLPDYIRDYSVQPLFLFTIPYISEPVGLLINGIL